MFSWFCISVSTLLLLAHVRCKLAFYNTEQVFKQQNSVCGGQNIKSMCVTNWVVSILCWTHFMCVADVRFYDVNLPPLLHV